MIAEKVGGGGPGGPGGYGGNGHYQVAHERGREAIRWNWRQTTERDGK